METAADGPGLECTHHAPDLIVYGLPCELLSQLTFSFNDHEARRVTIMKLYQKTCRLLAITAALCLPALALAQAPPTTATTAEPPGKSTVKADVEPSLIVMNARGASLQGSTLTLTGVSPNSIVFRRQARPGRGAPLDRTPA
jgi:hypothetical protein